MHCSLDHSFTHRTSDPLNQVNSTYACTTALYSKQYHPTPNIYKCEYKFNLCSLIEYNQPLGHRRTNLISHLLSLDHAPTHSLPTLAQLIPPTPLNPNNSLLVPWIHDCTNQTACPSTHTGVHQISQPMHSLQLLIHTPLCYAAPTPQTNTSADCSLQSVIRYCPHMYYL